MDLVCEERKSILKLFDGRTVRWFQTPEITGGRYSSLCTCVYEPGARAYPAHSHDHGEETIYIVSGTGKVKVGDDIYSIKPEMAVFFPEGVPHMVWNTGEELLKICCFYAPNSKAIEYTWHKEFDFPEFQEDATRETVTEERMEL